MREILDEKQVDIICKILKRNDNLNTALENIRSTSRFKYIRINKNTIIKIGKMMSQGKSPDVISFELSQEVSKEQNISKHNNYHIFISDYTVITGEGIDFLIENVKSSMIVGWVPYGGVSNIQWGKSSEASDLFFQAMVKYDY